MSIKKSTGLISGERGGHYLVPTRPIRGLGLGAIWKLIELGGDGLHHPEITLLQKLLLTTSFFNYGAKFRMIQIDIFSVPTVWFVTKSN